jgi:hypothetical protein
MHSGLDAVYHFQLSSFRIHSVIDSRLFVSRAVPQAQLTKGADLLRLPDQR